MNMMNTSRLTCFDCRSTRPSLPFGVEQRSATVPLLAGFRNAQGSHEKQPWKCPFHRETEHNYPKSEQKAQG